MRLRHSMGAIAHAKFELRPFHVAADRLFANPERLCRFSALGTGGDQTQDRDFPRRQPSGLLTSREIWAGQLLQT